MARFIGTIDDYEKYMGPRIRNAVNTFAKKEQDGKNGKCEFCGKTAELESVYKQKKEHETIIEALKKYSHGSYFDIDIEKCEQEILELHNPINLVFYFLCCECHKNYVSDNKPEITPEDTININGINVPLHKNENETTQNFVKKILRLFFNENFLPDTEIRNMLDRDYCRRTFGINYSILQNDNTRLRDGQKGTSRYWLNERFGNEYYACSQWWKTNEEIYKRKLSEWIKRIGKLHNR
jgi:hypothetical protein